MWRSLYTIQRKRIITHIVDRKPVILPRPRISQSGFMQNTIDPDPCAIRELAPK